MDFLAIIHSRLVNRKVTRDGTGLNFLWPVPVQISQTGPDRPVYRRSTGLPIMTGLPVDRPVQNFLAPLILSLGSGNRGGQLHPNFLMESVQDSNKIPKFWTSSWDTTKNLYRPVTGRSTGRPATDRSTCRPAGPKSGPVPDRSRPAGRRYRFHLCVELSSFFRCHEEFNYLTFLLNKLINVTI